MADQTAQYIFMHKDIPVAEFGLDSVTGAIVSIGQVYEPRHVPVGIPVRKGSADRGALNEWWRGRSIPASRSGIREAMRELRISDSRILAEKCLGLSLSDQYWICPVDSGISWRQVNFFENPFSEDVGNILLGKGSDSGQISLMSPDNTSDG